MKLAAAIIVVIALAAVYVIATTDNDTTVRITGGAANAFNKQGALDAGISRGLFSPDGGKLAVISPDGIGIATGGRLRVIPDTGPTAVDAAWMPNSASLLIAEGPAVMSRLTVLALDGTVTGVATLDAPFSVGDGAGLAVDRRGAHAIAVAETRDAIGGRRHRDLMLVDLATGHVTPLAPTANADEAWPLFVDDAHVVFARTETGRSSVVVEHDLTTGRERDLSAPEENARPVGVLRTGELVLAGGKPGAKASIWALVGGRRITLGRVAAGDAVWSVDPDGNLAAATQGSIVRAVTLKPPPGR